MNAVVQIDNRNSVAAMTEDELVSVLQSSLYPGAALPSIKLVLGYCKAANLDPMQKPVHIVPMYDRNAKQMKDVIMPGVGLYRTQAARSNALAGIGEPEFGPVIEFDLGGAKLSAPEWCRVVVKRMLANGAIGEFAAIEYWIENYATAGKDTTAPNTMWRKRPRGQLAKCAQAQALRMAFPEMVGAAPTADEMEGKELERPEVDITPKPEAKKPDLAPYPADRFERNKAKWKTEILAGRGTSEELISALSTKGILSDAQRAEILAMSKPAPPDDFDKALDESGDYTPE